MFEGILDDMISGGDDISSFFSSGLGNAAARGLAGGYKQNRDKAAWNEGFMGQKEYVSFNAGKADQAPTSEDFNKIETIWFQRMKRFAGLNDDTAVKLGAK